MIIKKGNSNKLTIVLVDFLTIFGVLFDGDLASTCHGHKNYKDKHISKVCENQNKL
jgi:hypothetical protein